VDAEGAYSILASDINKEREARLMTKFDHSINRPHIFKKNDLSILSDSRRSYVIGRFNCYAKLPSFDNEEVQEANLPIGLESILATDLYSESSALLCAQHAGLITDVLDQEVVLTVFGRMTTGKFDFSISTFPKAGSPQSKNLSVSNAQLEIDAGYEGIELFSIVEAKNQSIEDFHIRQLYYPYRLWSSKLLKPVVPVFFTYSNEIFSFYVYNFTDPNNYNSLQLIRRKHYRIVPTEIEVEDIRRILNQVNIKPEPTDDVPFPQADRFERVIDLLAQLYSKSSLTQEEITTNYDFDVRQTQYYTNAGRYLGLIDRVQVADQGVTYSLTDFGSCIMRKEPRTRNLALVELILSRKVFREAVRYYLTNAEPPVVSEIVKFMQEAGLGIEGETLRRRAQSVIGWIRWIMNLTTD